MAGSMSGRYINIGELQILGPVVCSSDTDIIPNIYDLDSDNDGCSDANEAYNDSNADGGDGSVYGTGTPPARNGNGTVTPKAYPSLEDLNNNGTFDFQEAGTVPIISVGPVPQGVFIGNNSAMGLSSTNADTHQMGSEYRLQNYIHGYYR